MREIKKGCYKGTRILLGNKKREKENIISECLMSIGFKEISIPIIQSTEVFENKVGDNNKMMFVFNDLKGRDICLSPEYTAVIQRLSKTYFKQNKDVKVFYIQECFRGEKPQSGRYRQFTQIGVEIINPTEDYTDYLIKLASRLCLFFTDDLEVTTSVKRGLDYYNDGNGFEISCPQLGSSKQVCGGGEYEGGIGFAIGLDRLMLASKDNSL